MSHDVVLAMLLFMLAPAKSQPFCSAEGDLVQLLQRNTVIGHSSAHRTYVKAPANNLSEEVLSNSAPKAVVAEQSGHLWSSGSVEFTKKTNSNVFQSSHIVAIPKPSLSITEVRDSEAQFGHAQTLSSRWQNFQSGLTFLYTALLTLPLIVLAIAVYTTCWQIEEPKGERPQVPPIPGWPIPSQQSPFMPSYQPFPSAMSSQMSLSTVSESTAQAPPMRSGTGLLSLASISSLPCCSPPPTAPAVAAAGPTVANSGLHYLMTARQSASSSATSIRTPSPFRTSIAALVSPRVNVGALPSASFTQAAAMATDASSMAAAPPMVGRAPTASQQGLKGVQGRVQWYSLGTPRPPEGFTTLPTPRPRY